MGTIAGVRCIFQKFFRRGDREPRYGIFFSLILWGSRAALQLAVQPGVQLCVEHRSLLVFLFSSFRRFLFMHFVSVRLTSVLVRTQDYILPSPRTPEVAESD